MVAGNQLRKKKKKSKRERANLLIRVNKVVRGFKSRLGDKYRYGNALFICLSGAFESLLTQFSEHSAEECRINGSTMITPANVRKAFLDNFSNLEPSNFGVILLEEDAHSRHKVSRRGRRAKTDKQDDEDKTIEFEEDDDDDDEEEDEEEIVQKRKSNPKTADDEESERPQKKTKGKNKKKTAKDKEMKANWKKINRDLRTGITVEKEKAKMLKSLL